MSHLNQQIILSQLDYRTQAELAELTVLDTIGSTNQWLIESDHCPAVCVAEQQSMGRGRRGHVWQSDPSGNIYFSLSWCVDDETLQKMSSQLPLLGLAVGFVLCDCLASVGLQGHGIKWPNDIWVNKRKLAGILIETTQNLRRIVIGIGINVEQREFGAVLKATSLALELSQTINRNSLISDLIVNLFKLLSKFPSVSYHDVLIAWNRWDMLKGKEVDVHSQSEQLTGLAMGINSQGELQLLLKNGDNISVNAADVSVRW
ncbi:MAG TPA: biotin--[acetyl-CoA-carboxylase] ligase [Thiotrichaceae bacterium]|nr:biotin--[acetyl-CoA-carboxylase] ligase [Thiotrichaceae bacterium]